VRSAHIKAIRDIQPLQSISNLVKQYCTLSLLVSILVRDLVKSEKREKAREKGSHEGVCESWRGLELF